MRSLKTLLPAVLLCALSMPAILFGQGVGINPTGQPAHPGAMLDVNAPNKGLLVPRTQSASITNPAAGMIVYDTVDMQLELYNGMQWLPMMTGGASSFWWADADGDTYGDPFNVIYAPMAPPFFVANSNDCNDASATAYPGAQETCDGIDNDCDGMIDEPTAMTCLIMGECYSAGDLNPENGCEVCDPSANNMGWTPVTCPAGQICCDGLCLDPETDPNHCGNCGITCDDGVPCTIDACSAGICSSTIDPNTCFINGQCYTSGDLNPSAECQVCDPASSQTGWTYLPAGTSCSSGICDGTGSCVECITAGECEDGLPCTIDICTAGVCITELDPNTCFIAGVCYNSGDPNPVAECQVCDPAVSQTGWTNATAGTPCSGGECDGNGNCN